MRARTVGIIMKKELKGLYAEKTIILAILLQLFIAMFSSFLMVGLATMYDPDSVARFSSVQYPIAYTGEESPLLGYLEESPDFRVYRMDLAPAVTALQERKLSAVLWVPATPPDAEAPVKITLYSIQNDIQATVVNVKLKDILLQYEEDLRDIRADRIAATPLEIVFPERAGGDFYEFVYGLLLPLLVFMPAIISSALIIDLVTEEYQHRTLEVLMSTPVTYAEMLWGKIAACVALVPVQAGIWLALLSVNGIPILHIPEILLHVSVGSLFLILMGAAVALHYRERTNAQFIFSTALVVVILFAFALPSNPLNLLVRLAVGSIGPAHWVVLAVVGVVTALFGLLITRSAARIEHALSDAG